MNRTVLAAAVAIAAVAFAPRAGEAREAPWCAISPLDAGDVIKDCSYALLEACIPYAIAGNRGFCTENPRYTGPPPKPPRKHRVRRR
jgi:Protein of unknown function (DUF3551)